MIEEAKTAHSGDPDATIGPKRLLGQDAGRVEIADDFDVPLDPETMS